MAGSDGSPVFKFLRLYYLPILKTPSLAPPPRLLLISLLSVTTELLTGSAVAFPNFASWPLSLIFIPMMAVKTVQVRVICVPHGPLQCLSCSLQHRLGPEPSLPPGKACMVAHPPQRLEVRLLGCPLLPSTGLSRPLGQLPVSSPVQACLLFPGLGTSDSPTFS